MGERVKKLLELLKELQPADRTLLYLGLLIVLTVSYILAVNETYRDESLGKIYDLFMDMG